MKNPTSEFYQNCLKAKKALPALAGLENARRTALLKEIAVELTLAKQEILTANEKDCAGARIMVSGGELSEALFNRLKLTPEKADTLSIYPETISRLSCTLNTADYHMELSDGLILERIRCPLGLIATIYESRPEVTVQVACLAIKSGNAFILKGGREAAESNRRLFQIIKKVLDRYGLADVAVQAETREQVQEILSMERTVDLIIPRGSNEFVRYIKQNSVIPVLGHADGICHIYLDEFADSQKAERIVPDAKTDYPAACNAVETLLYDHSRTELVIRILKLLAESGVTLHVCSETADFLKSSGVPFKLKQDSWDTEYCALELNVKQTGSLEEAIYHINTYGSGHTDAIITEDETHAKSFMNSVDSASVFHNASTRFADGYVFGLGAEVGNSTEKIHARGPVGIEGLLTTKYLLHSQNSQGDTRREYTENKKQYTHRSISKETP